MAGRCPRCGRGRLFAGFLRLVERCEACGLELGRHDTGDGPVAFVILLVGFLVVGAALVVEVKFGWPVWLHFLVWLPLALLLTLAIMRPLKGWLVGAQFKHRPGDFEAGHAD